MSRTKTTRAGWRAGNLRPRSLFFFERFGAPETPQTELPARVSSRPTLTHDLTDCARRTIWTVADRWRVVLSQSLFGLSDRYYAQEWTGTAGTKLRVCRAETAAWRAFGRAMRAADCAERREIKRQERRREMVARSARKTEGCQTHVWRLLVYFAVFTAFSYRYCERD